MTFEPLTEAEVTELNFADGPLGPSSKSCCKVLNNTSCGSGSLVGKRNGKSLVLTNAHVASTRIGNRVVCTFPFANNQQVGGRVIMAGYSNKVMMDWAVVELDMTVDLPHVKLMNEMPTGRNYTAGYPRCQGPYFQEIRTVQITHNGTVWQWQPNSIGGQSGSAVHSFADDLQYGLLTWSWGGNGAGQTVRSIWWQYSNRSAVGFPRPDDLIELADNVAEDLEEGFFAESNITTLPIWAHLDDPGDDDDDGDEPGGDADPAFAAAVLKRAEAMQKNAADLVELARKHSAPPADDGGDDDGCSDQTPDNSGPLFGLG